MKQSRTSSLILVLLAGFGTTLVAQETTDRITILTDDHGYFPCSDCHEDQDTVTRPRILSEEHYEPLEWEDAAGVTQHVPFGHFVAIADLLGQGRSEDMETETLARIGRRLQIEQYIQENDLAPTDSVWTLVHGGGNLWCLDCHDTDNRDSLVKLNGELLTFNESHQLCGECHGLKLRDWRRGIHGKVTGYWDADSDRNALSLRSVCVDCHTPHAPTFPAYQPLLGPIPRIGGGNRGAASEHDDRETEH